MRISTQMIFQNGAARMGDLQSGLLKTQEQLATGRKLLSPSDDPVAASRVLEISQSQSLNTQYGVNRQSARNALTQLEGTLAGVTDLVLEIQSAVTAADSGVLSDSERNIIAIDLQARFDSLLGLANTRDAQGNYLFSGYQADTPAFVQTAGGATYQGDSGQTLVQVDASRKMAINASGDQVFQGGGQDLFQTLSDLVTLLQTPVATPADQTALTSGLATARSNISLALDNILTVRASAGSRLNELTGLESLGEDRGVQYARSLSELQDVDYTQAITQLSQQQIALEAAQQSFAKISALSLFNYL
jgi:flagellar hook-associated protein 3 FlgL